ncbi:MAG: type II secretion system F family protein, partial [Gammaproteobacteria bacterium]|nr:type II secretion system F family protein [Gammaproteobacteria bacterium]
MPQFKYRAVDRTGKFTEGTTEQPSVARVADWLARDGLMAVSIQPTSSATKRAPRARKAGRRQNARERMLHFTRELSVMLSSGLPLDRSLGILHDLADPASAEMIADVRGAVRKGKSLGDAFAERPEFSPFYINMIRAGEASGSLEASLQRMTEYLERAKALRQLVMSALTYPAILFAVAILSLVFLLAYVVPSFADLFA